MLKTLTAIAALAALLAVNVTPAHAVLSGNGIHVNGSGENGIANNDESSNGAAGQSSTLSINAFELPPAKR